MASVPDFRWSAFYYQEVLAGLITLKRQTWPEHTEEDPRDPVIQTYRAFAVLCHLQAVRLDHAARELYWPTLRLRSSAIALARLMDYRLEPSVPASTDLVAEISGALTTARTVVAAHSAFATTGDPAILFEYDADEDLTAGPSGSWAYLEDHGGVVTDLAGALPHALWGGTGEDGDALYLSTGGGLMFDRLAIELAAGIGVAGWVRWEYRDDLRTGEPDTVVDLGGTIRLGIDSVIGATRADGLEVTVTCLRTGLAEVLIVDGSSGVNLVTSSGTLGQTLISTSPGDYRIESDWTELPGIDDGTAGLTIGGTISWALPQDTDRRWAMSDPAGPGSEDYWIRARIARSSGVVAAPTLSGVSEVRRTVYAVHFPARQGRRVRDKLGAGDGSARQAYALGRSPFLELVSVTVAGEDWTQAPNLLSSAAYDRHFTLTEQPDGSWLVAFGDGVTGKIPATSAEIVAIYRIGGEESGNVGASTITRDRAGNARLKRVWNPRAATGWQVQEGRTEPSLEELRAKVPASLRTRGRAVTLEDHEDLAVDYRREADGGTVAIRALAVEERSGPKTVGVVLVGPGNEAPSSADLAEVAAYFNGTTRGIQRVGGVGMANTVVTASGFTGTPIDVTVTVSILEDYASGAKAKIEAALAAILQPTATRQVRGEDGAWTDSGIALWSWAGEADPSVLLGAIYTAVSGVVGIAMTTPAAAVPFGTPGGLPVPGVILVTVAVI